MKRGEIWLINLDPSIGAEIRKTRPVLIINNDNFGTLPLRIILPITDWKDRYKIAPWMIKINPDTNNNLEKESSIDCFQIRSVSEERFIKKIGFAKKSILEQVVQAIEIVVQQDF